MGKEEERGRELFEGAKVTTTERRDEARRTETAEQLVSDEGTNSQTAPKLSTALAGPRDAPALRRSSPRGQVSL